MKKLTFIALVLLSSLPLTAQEDYEEFRRRAQAEYNGFVNRARQEYNEFRRKANEEYARFMEQAWEEMRVIKGEEPPKPPKPVRQPVSVPNKIPPAQPVPLPTPEVVPMPQPLPPPEIDPNEVKDEIEPPTPDAPTTGMTFYGSQCRLHTDMAKKIALNAVNEQAASQAWQQLSDGRYDPLLRDCLELRNDMMLCDWGYIELTHQAAVAAMGKECNEAVLLQAWLLSQSGLDIRIGKTNGHLVLLATFDVNVYSYAYVVKNERRFYVIEKSKWETISVFPNAFPKTHAAALLIRQMPRLAMNEGERHTFEAKHFANMRATVATNSNLMRFFDNYPHTMTYNYLVEASLSDGVKQQLYSALRQQLEGRSKKKQVQMLLDFVQTSFNYKTDDEQFGYERSFYGDECFFHPYSDCEDRAILFSILVRELVGLDVVLLLYPGHMATAVDFGAELPGSYYTIDGRHFMVCDPTAIGNDIGEPMRSFETAETRIVRINNWR